MSTFLSKDVIAGLEAAQKADLRKKSRLRVESNKNSYPVLQLKKVVFVLKWKGSYDQGFSRFVRR